MEFLSTRPLLRPLNLAACVLLLAFALFWVGQRFKRSKPTPHYEKQKSPSPPFQTPLPQPLKGYKLELTTPKLYRPFRHGRNFVTMGIRAMDWNEWIEMDSNFVPYHEAKVAELKKDVDSRVQYVENDVTQLACFEVLDELTQYLTHRYPDVFQLQQGHIHNTVTGERFAYPVASPKEAMVIAAKLVQDDLVIMVENADGQYHIDAGAVCLPGFWRLTEKFRMSLDELHIEAGVPHYQEKLQKAMNRFFKNMAAAKPVIRNNFFIQLDDGLAWSHRMGDQNSNAVASWAAADSTNLTVNDIHFRSERQSLRRLPKSKALLFTIRTYFEPVAAIAQEPHVPGRLAEAIRAWDDTVSYYKGRSHWEDLLLPYLDEMHQKQVASGVLDTTQEGAFPF
ncbi:hypothetical protein T440DRAFT_468575 [Plenodomus tracheiphilus IPT5]|uniref:Uncharacterized protein n=1 Tax=Plenodomus tracheiphilus IPT5 TaxID=1408161 RepID=A0A6A7B4R7_9PLEO|nr:hypothetical protein T440DRAFT_468575 [Plenodomus tracheiphilus IPT5]